jgi:hypothetical protein
MNKKLITSFALIATMVCALGAEAKTIRAKELEPGSISELMQSGGETTVEFRHGDILPVTFAADGDLVESTQIGTSLIQVKRDFWIRFAQDKIEISFDQMNYRPVNEVLSSSISATSGSGDVGGPINAINLIFNTVVKP